MSHLLPKPLFLGRSPVILTVWLPEIQIDSSKSFPKFIRELRTAFSIFSVIFFSPSEFCQKPFSPLFHFWSLTSLSLSPSSWRHCLSFKFLTSLSLSPSSWRHCLSLQVLDVIVSLSHCLSLQVQTQTVGANLTRFKSECKCTVVLLIKVCN